MLVDGAGREVAIDFSDSESVLLEVEGIHCLVRRAKES
jgi:hypothetical protein